MTCTFDFFFLYSRLSIIRALANSNCVLTRTKIDFLGISDSFTLGNSDPRQLEPRSNFRFSPRHFPPNFTFENSNHVCQYETIQTKQSKILNLFKAAVEKILYSSQFLDFAQLLSFVIFFKLRYVPIYAVI